MGKYIIDEGKIDDFVKLISKKTAEGKQKQLDKVLANDPILKKLAIEIEKTQKEMKDHIQANRLDKKTQADVDKRLNSREWFD